MMKEGSLDTSGMSKIFCYTSQPTDQKEKSNLVNKRPFLPFAYVNKETIGFDFDSIHLESEFEI